MKILLKIILFPIVLILGLIVSILTFFLDNITWLLNIVSSLLFLLGLFAMYVTFKEGMSIWGTIIVFILSYLCSPFGLPMILAKLIILVDELKDFLAGI